MTGALIAADHCVTVPAGSTMPSSCCTAVLPAMAIAQAVTAPSTAAATRACG